MTDFYDSVDIARIPAGVEWAVLYADGDYKSGPPSEVKRFPHRRWITVEGAPKCFIADYEPGNPVYEHAGELADWARARHARRRRRVVYCDISNVKRALAELDGLAVEWWIAHYVTVEPDQLVVAAQAGLPEALVWGCQWDHQARYDRSVLYGSWDG